MSLLVNRQWNMIQAFFVTTKCFDFDQNLMRISICFLFRIVIVSNIIVKVFLLLVTFWHISSPNKGLRPLVTIWSFLLRYNKLCSNRTITEQPHKGMFISLLLFWAYIWYPHLQLHETTLEKITTKQSFHRILIVKLRNHIFIL